MQNKETGSPVGIEKTLSLNDTGQTGGHQAGILVPKTMLFFFPELGIDTKNPRVILRFSDLEGQSWKFNFIYYNNRYFGGTRNEYRLTGMTSYIRQNNLIANDKITLEKTFDNRRFIKYERINALDQVPNDILVLGSAWKVIKL
ncbi:EcoRII N-terminal effector-binding domain-containing protein [Paenibacillus sp. FSL K6-2859]|jgi:hypothetical protein|uniref:EcoRII N-terminal effector-binding domain-containing protein n=1 Tax=Paenibacillus sp. FSL K6-2859 TaxID=2921482 RepID=UPI0030FC4A20